MAPDAHDVPMDTARFGAGRLFLADSRLALVVLNHARRGVLTHVFGVPPSQVNLLTFVLALGGLEATSRTARRASRAVLGFDSADAGIAAFALREGALAVGGPRAREVPGFTLLVTAGVVGALGVPAARRAVATVRAGELRVRLRRLDRYRAARRTVPGAA